MGRQLTRWDSGRTRDAEHTEQYLPAPSTTQSDDLSRVLTGTIELLARARTLGKRPAAWECLLVDQGRAVLSGSAHQLGIQESAPRGTVEFWRI